MFTPLEESVQILNKLHERMQDPLNAIIRNRIKYEIDDYAAQYMMFYVMDLGLIYSVSFLDELKDHFSKELTKQVGKWVAEPIMKAIKVFRSDINKKFPDLRDFRNHCLAHNMRMDNRRYKNVIIDGDIQKYIVPRNLIDYRYLIACINGIVSIVNFVFPTAYSNAEAHREDAVKKLPLLVAQFNTGEEIQIEIDKLKIAAENILKDSGLL